MKKRGFSLIEGLSPRFLAIFPYAPSSTHTCYVHMHTRVLGSRIANGIVALSRFMNGENRSAYRMVSHIVIGDVTNNG